MDKKELIKRNLKGLPGNLALSYLSTISYNQNGNMADWINYIAREEEITEIEIDILNKTATPKQAKTRCLLDSLEKLQAMIKSNLKTNKIDENFIAKATIRFEIPINDSNTIEFYCFPQLEDKNGVVYRGKKKIVGKASENFTPKLKKEESLLAKVREANKKK